MADLLYNFLDNNFTVYEPVEAPKAKKFNISPLLDPVDLPGFRTSVTTSNQETETPIAEDTFGIINNNPEEYTSQETPNPQSTSTQLTYNPSIENLKGNEKKAMEFFMSKGLKKHQAAGLVGNLIRESRLNSHAINPHGGAFGIAQWLGKRKTALFNKYGNNPTFEQLLNFVWEELNSTHRTGLLKLLNSNSVEEANGSAFGYYEFSAGVESALKAMRNSGQNGELSFNLGLKFARLLMK